MSIITVAMALVRKWPGLQTLPLFSLAHTLQEGTASLAENPELLAYHESAIQLVPKVYPENMQ